MKQNHHATQTILSGLSDLLIEKHIRISTENTDYRGRPSESDYVTVDQKNGIGFEVFHDETRVDFFDDHQHFGSHYTETGDYIQDTISFLRRLLSSTLVKYETWKGRVRIRYEWYFLSEDGRKDPVAGPWLKPLLAFTNPFAKKETTLTYWQFHKDTGTFIQVTRDTVAVHSYDWDIIILIRQSGSAYTFGLERYFFDEEGTLDYFWTPLHISGISFYDTQEKALNAAKEAASQYCMENKNRSIFET